MCEGLFTAWQGRRLLSRQWIHCRSSSNACQYTLLFISLLCPRPGGIKRWCCLTSVTYIWSAGCVCGRPAGWRVLADRPGSAGLADQGCRCALPLQAWAEAYRGGRPPTACYLCRRDYVFVGVSLLICRIMQKRLARFSQNLVEMWYLCHSQNH